LLRSVYNILTKLFILYVINFSGITIVSGQVPVANFTGSPLAGCSPLIVNFQDQSSGNPTAWNWSFGNGNTSTLQNPSASYFAPGTYTVVLTVTNVNGSNTLTRSQYITVYEPPVVNFSASPLSGCFPLRVQFTDLTTPGTGNTIVSWLWDFGNGSTSTLQNPLATYNTAGIFTVTLQVTDDKGCTKTFSRPNYVNATNGVTASFTHTDPIVCIAPATISFTNNSTGPPTLSYLWDFGDGNTSTVINPIHTYLSNGSFITTLITSSSAGCIDTMKSSPIVIGGINTSFNVPTSLCVNEVATFTNTSIPAPVSSDWTFGDGGTANSINATHSYSVPGIYTVWLYNTYSSCIDSISQLITVSLRPIADFSAPIRTKCEPPLTVNFQDLSSGGAVSWQWDFGDGNTSITQNPVHTYTNYGSFTVTLIASNIFGCSDTMIKANYIRIQRAAISIPILPAKGCIPFTITMVPVITSLDVVTSYDWDFGDGGTSTLVIPTHTYSIQGTYTVRLIITTSTGCSDTLTIPAAIRVGSKPHADFSATPIPVCGTQPVYFTDLTTPAADEWHWDFGDGGTSLIQNPSHRYGDTGYFTVRLIATNNGCPDTIVKTNYVRVLPPIAIFTPVPSCANKLQFSFTDQSIAPLTWEWDFGDGSPLSTVQNPVHTYPAFGNYTVRLIVTNGACADTAFRTVRTVDEHPDFTSDMIVACKIATINFTATNIIPANINNYDWSFGDGSNGNSATPSISHTYITAGTYTVTLTTTDFNGCNNIVSKANYIRINGASANFSATNVSGCSGLTTTFNDLSFTDGINAISNWQWDFGDGAIQNFSGPPFQHTYNNAGIFSVKLIITDAAGCKDSITINDLVTTTDPLPEFTSADTLTCPGATVTFTNTSSPAGISSLWNFGDGGSSSIISPTHVYAASGIYTVKLRILDTNGCADSLTRNAYINVDRPVANFSMNDSISSCTPFEVQFTNTSSFYNSVLWDFGPGEGTSALTNPVHYYSVPGIYPVKLLITSPGGCLDSVTKSVTVSDTIGSRFNYLPLSGCKPELVNLNTNTNGQIASFFWDFGDGYTQTTSTPNVSHLYSSFGNFLPKVIMHDPSGCLIPLQGLDTIYITGANAKFGIDTSLFCDFGTVHFSDSTTFNDPVTSFNWTFGDGATSSIQNPVHTFASPGIYAVRLIVQTQIGCRDTITKPNLVKVVQRPLIDIAGDSVVCVNSSLQNSGRFIQPDTSVVTWQWNFPNGNTSNLRNPPAQIYRTAGTFIITTIATNSTGCKDTTRQNVYVNPLPVVQMPVQMTVQNGFPVTIPATFTPNTVSWIWSPSDGLSCANCPTPEAGPKFDTRYLVYFTDRNGCSNTSNILVTVICKNSNLFIPNTFSPNGDGSNDVFYPRGKGLERIILLRIFNRWGEVVFEKRNFPVNDPASGWDGTFKGKKPQADVYVYQAEVFCDNGDIIKLNGNIALIL
jgi:gliding motility-associated-like protein